MEQWLIKWKMKVAANKCRYMIFSRKKSVPKLKLILNKEAIPYTEEMKFLGLIFDRRLNFNSQVTEIRKKCNDRLNIIKILSNKNWKLNASVLGSIYKSLIGSIIDYSFMCLHVVSNQDMTRLQAIQNKAIRSIFRKPYTFSGVPLAELATSLKLSQVKHRLDDLNERYVRNGIQYSNELLVSLVNEFWEGFGGQRFIDVATSRCGCRIIIENWKTPNSTETV